MDQFYKLVKDITLSNAPSLAAQLTSSVQFLVSRHPIRDALTSLDLRIVQLDVEDRQDKNGCILIVKAPCDDWEDVDKYSLPGPRDDKELSISASYQRWIYDTDGAPHDRFIAMAKAHLFFHLTSLAHQLETIEKLLATRAVPISSVICFEVLWSTAYNSHLSFQSDIERLFTKIQPPHISSCAPILEAVRAILYSICQLFPDGARKQKLPKADYFQNVEEYNKIVIHPSAFLRQHADQFNQKIDEELNNLEELAQYYRGLKQSYESGLALPPSSPNHTSDRTTTWRPSRAEAIRLALNMKKFESLRRVGFTSTCSIPRVVLVYAENQEIFSSICYTSTRNEQLRSITGFLQEKLNLRWRCDNMKSFSAKLFRDKCANIRPLLLVAEEADGRGIFGLYTERGWGDCLSNDDQCAFVFSVVNPQNAPFRTFICPYEKTTATDRTGCPTFGNDQICLLNGGKATIGRLDAFEHRDRNLPYDARSFILNGKNDAPFYLSRVEIFEKNK